MKTTIDYTSRTTKAFDAVEDIKSYLGKVKWDEVSPLMSKVTNPEQFAFYAMLPGIEGYPVEAWYELYHGQGSWAKAWASLEASTGSNPNA